MTEIVKCEKCGEFHHFGLKCEGKPSLVPARGSVRTCEWETVSPPKICGKPAAFFTTGKYMCQEHGEHINRRWPGAAKPLQAPNVEVSDGAGEKR